jgi:hypothetical protein
VRTGAIHAPPPARVRSVGGLIPASALTPPAQVDWLSRCPATGDALGNDAHGDCCEAADYNLIAIRRAAAMGDAWRPTGADALGRYAELTGFDPATGANDGGTQTVADLADWCARGIRINDQDLDVPLWAFVAHDDLGHVRAVLGLAGPLLVTLALPAAASDLSAWAAAPGDGAAWEAGGYGDHRVVLGYASDSLLRVRTWGWDVDVSPEFFSRYVLGVDAILSREWFGASGVAPSSVDWDALKAAVTGAAAP